MNASSESSAIASKEIPESVFCAIGNENTNLSDRDIQNYLHDFLKTLGKKENILLLPPDFTRFHSQAGKITQWIHEYYNSKRAEDEKYNLTILPALGTHAPMTPTQIRSMFGESLSDMEPSPFVVHDWRNDVMTIGHAPAEMVN